MHLIKQKAWNLLPQLQKIIQNVKKMGNGKSNIGSLSHFKRRHFDVLEKNKKNITFLQTITCRDNSENRLSQEKMWGELRDLSRSK